jgi:hypothetical protein
MSDRCVSAEQVKAAITGWETEPTDEELVRAIDNCTPPAAKWKYHNDEHGTWWGCTNCGKVCRRNPHEKLFCSRCGFSMSMES